MKHGIRFLTLIFAMFLIVGTFVLSASAQTRYTAVRRVTTRPVIVRRYVVPDPFWRYRYYGSPFGYAGYYDPYWSSPYLRYQDQKFYLQKELRDNERELRKHQEKYRADGFISAKEREELEDDIRDVQRARRQLNEFLRRY